jgi:hypothetical protein
MTGVLCVLSGASGGSDYAGSAVVTTDVYNNDGDTLRGFAKYIMGSVSPTTWANTGRSLAGLYHYIYTNIESTGVSFGVYGSVPNSGWTTMTVNGVVFTRASASYYTDGYITQWQWPGASNPFGTTIGATRTVVWS